MTGDGFPEGENDRSMSVNIRNIAWCLIEGTISRTEFKCRVEDLPLPVTPETEDEFMVMLRLTLFAECDACKYKFSNNKTPKVLFNQKFEGNCNEKINLKVNSLDTSNGDWTAIVGPH